MTDRRKRLLVVYASATGGTTRLANAVVAGARTIVEIDCVLIRAADADAGDLLAADGYVIGTPENFGTLAGAMKDFLDRVYYPCETLTQARPYAIVVSAGNDGRGAVAAMERIATGLRWKRAAEPLVARHGVRAADLDRCAELGATLAAGIAYGIL